MTAACRVVKAIGLIWLHIDSAVSWHRRCNIAYQCWQKTDMASEPSCSVKLLTFTVRVSQGLTGCWTQSFLHFNGLYQAFLQDILCQYWFPESIYSYCHICQVFFLSARSGALCARTGLRPIHLFSLGKTPNTLHRYDKTMQLRATHTAHATNKQRS